MWVIHVQYPRSDKRELPVLWHQSLLTFCQRYKQDVSSEQKQALLEICKVTVRVLYLPINCPSILTSPL